MNNLPIFSFFYFQIQIWTYKWTWKGKKKKRMDDVSILSIYKRFSCIVDLLRNRKQISPQKQSFIDFVLFWKFYTPTTTHHNGFLGFLFKTLEPWDSKAPKCKPYHYLIENRALVKQRELKVLFEVRLRKMKPHTKQEKKFKGRNLI